MTKMTLRELAEATGQSANWRKLRRMVDTLVEERCDGFMRGVEIRLLIGESLLRGERVYEIEDLK